MFRVSETFSVCARGSLIFLNNSLTDIYMLLVLAGNSLNWIAFLSLLILYEVVGVLTVHSNPRLTICGSMHPSRMTKSTFSRLGFIFDDTFRGTLLLILGMSDICGHSGFTSIDVS